MKRIVGLSSIAVCTVFANPALAQISESNGVTAYTFPERASAIRVPLDYANARPMPLSRAATPTDGAAVPQAIPMPGPPRYFPGMPGTGELSPVRLVPPLPEAMQEPTFDRRPQEYGTINIPYTTSRVNAYNQPTATFYPFSATGRLFFTISGSPYVCSASLIKPGIIVTAAHCIAGFGTNSFYSNFQFVPAYNNGEAPYGVYTSTSVRVMTSWLNGTDTCSQAGVVCTNDVGVINLYTGAGMPGLRAGVYGYGIDGYGFTAAGLTLVNQLGYPVALDTGKFMERTDSQGFKGSTFGYQDYVTIIGSLQTGGASGGPWLNNLGRPPLLNGTSFGSAADHNIVVGVASFAPFDPAYKFNGASRFTSNNIQFLVTQACAANPGKC